MSFSAALLNESAAIGFLDFMTEEEKTALDSQLKAKKKRAKSSRINRRRKTTVSPRFRNAEDDSSEHLSSVCGTRGALISHHV